MNSVTLVGNLVEDPELRFTPSGVALCNLRFAVNRRWKNNNTGEWEEEAHFFSGSCWRDLAENVAESFSKGDRVIVSGRLQQRSWETQEGERRSVVEVSVTEIGPSLRWATATVRRVHATRDNDNTGHRGNDNRRGNDNSRGRDRYARDEAPF